MITASHLTKTFGSVTAIADVSFHVSVGEVVGFLGPNGAGKTTTMRILAGIFPPTRGTASIAGHDVLADSIGARRSIGYFPEYAPLYPDLSVEQYLRFVGCLKRIPRGRRGGAVTNVLSSCRLEGVAHRLIGKLSKGYRQRVGLAQALLGDPPVLILDEPTIGLDPEQAVEIRRLIASMGGTRAVLFSSHILSEVEALCSRVVVLDAGRVIADGTPVSLTAKLGARHRIVIRVDAPRAAVLEVLSRVERIPAAEPAPDGLRIVAEADDCEAGGRALAEAVQAHGWTLLELRHEPLPLEGIFFRLVNRPPVPES
jgi:ABC-2 type transport system ATP-binding protein